LSEFTPGSFARQNTNVKNLKDDMDFINDEMQLLGFHNIKELSHSQNDNDQTSNKGSI